ncbi:hypothetical protein J8M21_20790 [Pseudoalteromonas luteoviolacea]|uniref:hypothetical protein n=1 Tax=Pseudoalteromonas luteoviolacea TaxID=43657 RepID=UPI001B3A78F9|nr:hypothetical protein [Pseudoalteromonas luteoviolacea]MBQ4879659.1 hypothetical protein [Pseudoalteromonas luteoviolacea]MBQ4908667.1 hypothetical protein [Pseudoalteromonas luteoviolacea]
MIRYPNHQKYLSYATERLSHMENAFSQDEVVLLRLELDGVDYFDFETWRDEHAEHVKEFLYEENSASCGSPQSVHQLKIRLACMHVLSEAVSLLTPLVNSTLLELEDTKPDQIFSWSEIQQNCHLTKEGIWPFEYLVPCPFSFD